jgi:hypothetical protein
VTEWAYTLLRKRFRLGRNQSKHQLNSDNPEKDAKEKIETCLREIDDILHQAKLKGNCKYTRI